MFQMLTHYPKSRGAGNGSIRVRCSIHVFIKGSSYTLAIMARTKREYLGEKLRILAELTMVN